MTNIAMKPQPTTQEVLAGLVERVTYHNAENGFCVLARGVRDIATVVGHSATIAAAIDRVRRMDQRPHPWPAVQSKVSAHFAPQIRPTAWRNISPRP